MNISFDDEFVKNSLIIASRIDIIEINISTFSIRAVVSRF